MALARSVRPGAPVTRSAPRRRRGRLAAVAVLALGTLGSIAVASPASADTTGCPCSLWSDSTTPAIVDYDDPNAVELGVQFTVDVAAPITGLKFYKSAANVGTHVGSLWTSDGTLLARATFTNETPSGWQKVSFSTPVQATPGTRYVASYHTPSGHYSVDPAYFFNGPYRNGILEAPGHNPEAPNGLFTYSPVPTFPTGTWNDNNYWIDVIIGGATTPPPGPVTLTSVTVAPESTTLRPLGTTKLKATGTYSNGTTADVTGKAKWSSSNVFVAVPGNGWLDGWVLGLLPGSARITANVDGVKGSATIKVKF